ncbi:MAG TPA: hypothetical protein DCY26_12485 [Hyphomonas sp.]|nr:hypothetical protein [Hyphomonas sp.]
MSSDGVSGVSSTGGVSVSPGTSGVSPGVPVPSGRSVSGPVSSTGGCGRAGSSVPGVSGGGPPSPGKRTKSQAAISVRPSAAAAAGR